MDLKTNKLSTAYGTYYSEAIEAAKGSFETGHRCDRKDFEDPEVYEDYLILMDKGPSGFLEEFEDYLEFDPDFVAQYGDPEEYWDPMDEDDDWDTDSDEWVEEDEDW